MFQQFSPANFSVPDLAGLMERFFRIPLAVSISTRFQLSTPQKSVFELYMVLFSRFSRSIFLSTGLNTHRVFSPVNFSGNKPGNMLFGPIISKN